MCTLCASAHVKGRTVENQAQCPCKTLKCPWEVFPSFPRDCVSNLVLIVFFLTCCEFIPIAAPGLVIFAGSQCSAWISVTTSYVTCLLLGRNLKGHTRCLWLSWKHGNGLFLLR